MDGRYVVKFFEDLRLDAYLCPAKKWTIGYGCTFYEDGTPVKQGDSITKDRAEALFEWMYSKKEKEMLSVVKVPLTNNQIDALTSFVFNVGLGAFKSSTMLRLINSGNMIAASEEFQRWVYGNGKILPGLVKRRKLEKTLFIDM